MKSLRIPLLLFALPAAFLMFAPGWHGWLLLDRDGLLQGEWWRLWTGHWVHFSGSHLTWNLAVLLAAGAWLESVHPGRLLRYTLFGAPIISLMVLAGEPALRAYGGLSGVTTGIVVLLALTRLGQPRLERIFWVVLLMLVAGKSVYEAILGVALFSRFDAATVQPSAFAHLAGLAVAVAGLAAGRLLASQGARTEQSNPVSRAEGSCLDS